MKAHVTTVRDGTWREPYFAVRFVTPNWKTRVNTLTFEGPQWTRSLAGTIRSYIGRVYGIPRRNIRFVHH